VKLLLASRSPGKLREFRRVLHRAGVEVVAPDDAGLYPAQAEDLLELGESFEANARR
jgi:inosine/xanthosine triphosphate pyrophosphatase family protein